MSDVNANIRVNIDTHQATAQLAALQKQVTTLQTSMAAQQRGAMGDMGLGNVLPGLKNAQVQIRSVASATSLLDKQLSKTSAGFAQSFGTMQRAFRGVGAEMQLATQKANILRSQYITLGADASGAVNTVARATTGVATNMQVLQQRMAIATRALDQMGTAALNWGKNMQWAGRQLVVGFTVPLTIFSALAVKSFQDVERAIINFRRVYGDFDTPEAETARMTESVKELAIEFSNLGFTAQETIELAGKAAATGSVGAALEAQVEQATKLAALGQISQEQSLDTIISLSTAFGIQADKLGETVDFLNAVENQTVLALEDVSEAIPLVAPVIKGLGGDVRDLTVMLTAMREGGVNANEAANALKTSLARLITPTRQAKERAAEFGISLETIVNNNAGDLMGMIDQLGMAMESLSEIQKQQLLSDVFGKRQFARMGTMFANINKEGSQAARTMELVNAEASELAALSEKELNAVRESASMQFAKAMQEFKLAIAPIGEMILSAITPLLEFGTKVANFFNDLSDGAKKFGVGFAAAIGVIIPAGLMLTGLFANLAGQILNFFAKIGRGVNNFKYLSNAELEAAQAAKALDVSQDMLASGINATNSAMTAQVAVLEQLRASYSRYAAQINSSAGAARGQFFPRAPLKFATGGQVPGSGNKDTIPALLTPGEMVINKSASQKHGAVLKAINSGSVGMYAKGKVDTTATVNLKKGEFQGTRYVSSRGGQYDFSNYAKLSQDNQKEVGELIDRLESWSYSQDDILKALDTVSVDLSDGTKQMTRKTAWAKKWESDPATKGMYETGQTRYLAGQTQRSHMEGRGAGAHQEMSVQNIDLYADKNADIQLTRDANKTLTAAGQPAAFKGRALGNMVLNEDILVNQLLRSGEAGTGQGWANKNDILKAVTHTTTSEKTAVQMWQAQQMTNLDDLDEAQRGLIQAYDGYKQKIAAIGENDIIVETLDNNPKAREELDRRIASHRSSGSKGPEPKMVVMGDLYDEALDEVAAGNNSLRQWRTNIEESAGGFRMQGSISDDMVQTMNNTLESMTEAERAAAGIPKNLQKFSTRAVGEDGRKALVGHYDDGTSSVLMGSQAQSTWKGDSPWNWNKGPQTHARPKKGASTYGPRMMGESLKARQTAINAELKLMGEQLSLTASETGSKIYKSLETSMATEMEAGRLSATLKEHVMEAIAMTEGQTRDDAMRLGSELVAALDPNMSPQMRSQAIKNWENFGQSIGLGLTGGMKSMKVPAGQEAQALGLWINNEFKRVEGIASPSTVWQKFGEWLADGLTLGLRSKKPQLAAAGAEAAQTTNVGFQSQSFTGETFEDGYLNLATLQAVPTEQPVVPKTTRLGKFAPVGEKLKTGTAKIGGSPVGGALMMGSMLPMMMADDQGKIAGKVDSSVVMSGMMMAGMFQMMIPMLSGLSAGLLGLIGVVGGLAAALGLAAFAVYKWRDGVDKASESALQAGKSLSKFGDNLQTMNSVLGTSSLLEQAASSRIRTEAEKIQAAERFGSQLDSEEGQEMLDELKKLSSDQREQKLSGMVVSSVQSGSLSKEDAAVFAKEVGLRIGDESAGVQAAANAMKAAEGAANMLAAANADAAKVTSDYAYEAAQKEGAIRFTEASRAIGIASSGIASYNEVIAKAELEYRDGTITYNKYIDIIREASAAQDDYNRVILNALGNSSDVGATMQALKRGAESIIGKDKTKELTESVSAKTQQPGLFSMGERGPRINIPGKDQSRDMFNIQRSSYEAQYVDKLAQDDPRFAGKSRQALESMKIDGRSAISIMGEEAAEAAKRVSEMATEMESASYLYVQQGRSVEEVITLLNYIQNNPTGGAAEAFDAGERNFDALTTEGLFDEMSNGAELREKFAEQRPGGEIVLPKPEELVNTAYYLSQIADEEERAAEASRLAAMSASQREVEATGKALGISDALLDTEMVKQNGMEAINAITEVMNSADLSPAQQDFLFQTLLNGSIVDPQKLLDLMEDLNVNASRLANVPSDILMSLDINPDDPVDQEKYGTEENVDKMMLADTMMQESLPEEVDRESVARFIIMDGKGNILDPDEMSKNLVNVKKAWNKLSSKDGDVEEGDIIEFAMQVMPKVTVKDPVGNETEVDDANGAQAVYDMINNAIGLDSFNALDMGTRMAILNLAIQTNVEGAQDAARAIELQSLMASGNMGPLQAQAAASELAAIDARQAARQAEFDARSKAMADGNGSSGPSGGGGGGNDEKDWIEQLAEDAKESQRMYGRLIAEEGGKYEKKKGWIQWLRKNTKLSEEAIQEIIKDEEALKKIAGMSKKEINQLAKKDARIGLREVREEARAEDEKVVQETQIDNRVGRGRDGNGNVLTEAGAEAIKNDPRLMAAWEAGGKEREKAVKLGNRLAAQSMTLIDLEEERIDREQKVYDAMKSQLDLSIAMVEYGYEKQSIPLREKNVTLEAQMADMRAANIKPLEELIEDERYHTKQLERQARVHEDIIESYQEQVDAQRRLVDDMRRALELRQREGEMLSHDSKLMGWMEEDITEAYDKRVEALDEVAELNERIAQSQKDQLGLANALSQGDIGAAALAAQEMQQNQMQANMDQTRYQMEKAKDNAIDTLTGPESGLTAEQIEERQRQLEEDSYYTNLSIRDIEDEIYNLNIKIRDENDKIKIYKDQIKDNAREIADYEFKILKYEREQIEPLQDNVDANDARLKSLDAQKLVGTENARIQLGYLELDNNMQNALNDAKLAGLRLDEAMGKTMKVNVGLLKKATKQAANYWEALSGGDAAYVSLSNIDVPNLSQALTGVVNGAKLDLSQFTSDFENIVNQNSTTVPTYSLPTTGITSGATGGIMSSVTNNNYNSTNNVTINEAGAPFDIDKTVRAMKFASESQVG